jgi:hypothetical protein
MAEGDMLKRLAQFKTWLAVKMMPFVAKNAPSALNEHIQKRASDMAVQVTMGYLAREGFVCCKKCPRRAPLVRIGESYFCRIHAKEEALKAVPA